MRSHPLSLLPTWFMFASIGPISIGYITELLFGINLFLDSLLGGCSFKNTLWYPIKLKYWCCMGYLEPLELSYYSASLEQFMQFGIFVFERLKDLSIKIKKSGPTANTWKYSIISSGLKKLCQSLLKYVGFER